MSSAKILKVMATMNISAAGMLLLWWILMGVGLPVEEAADHFDVLVAHTNWMPINLIGLAACLLWLVSLPSLFLVSHKHAGMPGFIGSLCAGAGIALFTSIQYYETFIWPVVVRTNADLLKMDGALVFGSNQVLIPLLGAGVILGLGYILLGLDLFRKRILPRAAVVALTAGIVLFGNGIAFPVRTLGLLSFCTGMVWIGVHLRRKLMEYTPI